MYASKVGSQKLTFSVSGKLWNRSLVMMDQETKSLWSHILGLAMDGKLKGKRLQAIPSTMTDWGTWRELHPQTTVANLSRTSREFRRDFYRNASRFVLGVSGLGEKPKAWSFVKLTKQPVVNDKLGDRAVVILFEEESKTALAFDRKVDGKLLTFERRKKEVVDRETGSTWNPLNGQATAGKLKGKTLRPITSLVSFTRAWVTFHPDTLGLSEAELAQARQGGSARRRLSPPDRKKQLERRRRLRTAIELMKKLDTNSDGKLSKSERGDAKLPEKADADGDGIVTFKELVRSIR